MDLLESTFLYDLQSPFMRLLEDTDLGLVADHTDFVFVDGEEGDHGVVRYRNADGQLIAEHVIHGGDSDDWNLTPLGAELVKTRLMALFAEVVETKVQSAATLLR